MAQRDREDLGFVEETRRSFGWLVADYDFVELRHDLYSVAYRGPHGWLTVIHDRLSYELDVALVPGEAPEGERPCGMADLMRAAEPQAAGRYRCFAATTASGMRDGLHRLVEDLRRYGGPALAGDRAYVEQLFAGRDRATEQFAQDQDLRIRDPEAAESIRQKDWAAVVALYEPIEHRLDTIAAKRLELARKRLNRGVSPPGSAGVVDEGADAGEQRIED